MKQGIHIGYREPGPCPVKLVFYRLNIDAQDAQDSQDESFLHQKPTPAVIACGFADVQDCKAAVSRKILSILSIHVN